MTFIETHLTPLSVVLAAILIAGAIVWKDADTRQAPPRGALPGAATAEQLAAIAPVTAEDHIRGNPDAPVIIVEYSDTECPFCKRFHDTMRQVMDEYGASGKVAWVYRHFPLDSLHQKARREAVALECAAEQGGNDAFWRYADRLFEITPSNDGLDLAELPSIAAYVGLDRGAFESCLASGRHDARIEADLQNAQATGGNGTPWSILITRDGRKQGISGAQPYESLAELIEQAL